MLIFSLDEQKLGLFPSAHAIAMGDKEYHGAVNIGATMKARYNAWQHRVNFLILTFSKRLSQVCSRMQFLIHAMYWCFVRHSALRHVRCSGLVICLDGHSQFFVFRDSLPAG